MVYAVAEPHDVEAFLAFQDTRELLGKLGALRREGLRLKGSRSGARGTRCLDAQRERLGARCRGGDDHRTIGVLGL